MIIYEGHKVYMDGKYPAIFLNGKNTHIHRLEWIKNNGEIPDGFIIHHKNENKLDFSIQNLELLSRTHHILVHKDIVKRKGVKVTGYFQNEIFLFNNIRQASSYTGCKEIAIHRILKRKQHQSKGWVFELGWSI